VAREGLPRIAGGLALRLLSPVYQRLDLVYVELELGAWRPRLKRRAAGTEVVEITAPSLSRWAPLFDREEAAFFDEQLALGSRLFLAVRGGALAGIVGATRYYHDRRWRVRCEVAPDELILFRVSVMPDFRRGAVGGCLVEGVLEALQRERVRRVVGIIASGNQPSLVLAENLGLAQFLRQRIHRVFRVFRTAPRTIEGRRAEFSGRRRAGGSAEATT
jgi:RimJ/RimL family protein N-acetyltransferase